MVFAFFSCLFSRFNSSEAATNSFVFSILCKCLFSHRKGHGDIESCSVLEVIYQNKHVFAFFQGLVFSLQISLKTLKSYMNT